MRAVSVNRYDTIGERRGGLDQGVEGGCWRATEGQQRLTACRSPPAPAAVDPLTVGDVMRSGVVSDDELPPLPM